MVDEVDAVFYNGKAYFDGWLRIASCYELACRFHHVIYFTAQAALGTEVYPIALKGRIPESILHLFHVCIARFLLYEKVLKMF